MAAVSAIRAQIKAILDGVANIGVVHDYERFAKTKADLVTLYTSNAGGSTRVRGWWFDRVATQERDVELGTVRRIHTWRIVGYLSLDDADATGKLLQDLMEAIGTAFRAQRTLGGTVLDIRDLSLEDAPSGIQVDGIEPVMFADVLCHRASLRLVTETLDTV